MSEIHSKISLHRFSLFPYQSIKITWLLTIFIHWLLRDVTTFGTTPTYFKRAAGLNRDNLDTYKPEEDFKPGFEEKIKFFRFFKNFFKKVIIAGSFDSQLQLNWQQIYCSHEISFHFWMNRWTDISSDINRWNRKKTSKIY